MSLEYEGATIESHKFWITRQSSYRAVVCPLEEDTRQIGTIRETIAGNARNRPPFHHVRVYILKPWCHSTKLSCTESELVQRQLELVSKAWVRTLPSARRLDAAALPTA